MRMMMIHLDLCEQFNFTKVPSSTFHCFSRYNFSVKLSLPMKISNVVTNQQPLILEATPVPTSTLGKFKKS